MSLTRPVSRSAVRPIARAVTVTSPGVVVSGVSVPTSWATFDGDSGYLFRAPVSATLYPTGYPWKMGGWVFIETATDAYNPVCSVADAAGFHYRSMTYHSDSGEMRVLRRDGGSSDIPAVSITTGWHEVIYEETGNTAASLTIDGTKTNLTVASRDITSVTFDRFAIGAERPLSPSNFFGPEGKVSRIKLWISGVVTLQYDLDGDATDSSGNSEDATTVADVTYGP